MLEKMQEKLKEIAGQMKSQELQVGFLQGATYPDGSPVASVAFKNEYGDFKTPPRPFFRIMIAKNSPEWAATMSRAAKHYKYDGGRTLAAMGELIAGQLQQSITELKAPPLAPSTIAKKGFDKPLIDTSHMINSVGYVVNP